jgi:hypothetical protein
VAGNHSYVDFTESAYRELLHAAKSRYAFVSVRDALSAPAGSVLWRHDLDLSVHRARRIAEIEAEEGVRSTFFILLHSAFYNPLEWEVADRIRSILAGGHELGLHFDPLFFDGHGEGMEGALAKERRLLEEIFDCEVRAFSLHNPELAGWNDGRDEIAGMTNVYGDTLRGEWTTASDSSGYWRFGPIREVIESGEHERLHVLTHPEWWVPEPMSPRERVNRAIEGRAAYQHGRFDGIVAALGRTIDSPSRSTG